MNSEIIDDAGEIIRVPKADTQSNRLASMLGQIKQGKI
jgi:hypothetical protein